jgi:HlyD family secretion protein
MASQKRRILGFVAAVVVLGSIVGFNLVRENRKRVEVQTQLVARRDLVSLVTASGEVKPKRYVNVGANVSGRIVELSVVEGQRVKKNQVLARIESERFEAGERQSEAAMLSSQADLDRALADLEVSKLDLERTRKMFQDKLVSEQVYDTANAEVKMKTAAVEATRRRVAQLQAQLDSTRDDLKKTTVLSPMDGVVTSLPKEEGEVVIGAQSFNPTVLMTVADLSVMECEILVDETDIRNLSLGQRAEVRVDALEGVKVHGEVTEIGSSAIPRGTTGTTGQTTPQTGSNTGNQAKDFRVTITLIDPPKSLRPGLNATADITTATRKSVSAVPIQAVVVRELDAEGKVVDPDAAPAQATDGNTVFTGASRPQGEEKDGVFVVKEGKSAFRPVKTGILGDTDVEVLEGLKDGEEIVTGTYKALRTLKDGARLKIENKKKSS